MKKTDSFKIIEGIILRITYFTLGLIMASVLSSCSSSPEIKESDLTPYFDNFLEDAKKNNVKIDMKRFNNIEYQFKSLQSPAAGQCRYFPAQITIDPSTFYTGSTERTKKLLVYHELGHCYCRRDHMDIINTRTVCPESLMNSYIPSNDCIRRYMKDYIKELFENC